MNVPTNQDGGRKKNRFQPEPLCLFRIPEEVSLGPPVKKTYVPAIPRREPETRLTRRKISQQDTQSVQKSVSVKPREKEDVWLRKRTEARIIRRRMKEPIRNLKSYLLTSVNYVKVPQKLPNLPSLFEVLETVKDAWPTPPGRNIPSCTKKDPKKPQNRNNMILSKTKMKEEIYLQFPSPLINRRFSMPEELMRKYAILKEKTSDDSETNKTMIEITSSTSSAVGDTTRRKSTEQSVSIGMPEPLVKVETTRGCQGGVTGGSSDQLRVAGSKPVLEMTRVSQVDYYKHGRSIIKVKGGDTSIQVDVCTCRNEKSSSTLSAKEETDESGTTESGPSSSPVPLPKKESSSGNLSSESEFQCTCRELTSSKETSTDIFHSGKSTLSQTISERSLSTQDSTISVKSVSTRGSTPSDNSNTTTSEVDRASAKESTSDYSPRTPRNNGNRKNRRRDNHKKSCPRYQENRQVYSGQVKSPTFFNQYADETGDRSFCGTISMNEKMCLRGTNDDNQEVETIGTQIPEEHEESRSNDDRYTWAKLSHEELYMMQQLRHQKLLERGFTIPPECSRDPSTVDDVLSTMLEETDNLEQSIMIPRYSALPRTLSMLVNTSSGENSIPNSDSDNQSLADSLEDQPTTHVHKFFFDTKNESKPVRGDVIIPREPKERIRIPKGRAFFVSIKDPFGEDELLDSIKQVPQPPDRIKNQISARHLNICSKHKHSQDGRDDQKRSQKRRKERSVRSEDVGKTFRQRGDGHRELKEDDNKKVNHTEHSSRKKTKDDDAEGVKRREDVDDRTNSKKQINQFENENTKRTIKRKKESKEHRNKATSKIPVLVGAGKSPSSPERDSDNSTPHLVQRSNKENEGDDSEENNERHDGGDQSVETTEIMEITQTDKGITLQKPHAIICPSQNRPENFRYDRKTTQLTIPPLAPSVRTQLPQQPFRQPIPRSVFLSQTRRSPVGRFRQRFEVIPEEKSSSLSSAEEKSTVEPLPKFRTTSTSPLPMKEDENTDKLKFESYKISDVPNLIVAQIEDKQLKTLPYVKGPDDQNIILLSTSKPENSNSIKGRDALIAMNRDDFNRLAKGWLNFYKLSENSEHSDGENKGDRNNRKRDNKVRLPKPGHSEKGQKTTGNDGALTKIELDVGESEKNSKKSSESAESATYRKVQQGKVDLGTGAPDRSQSGTQVDENIRFHSSNTILRATKATSPDLSISSEVQKPGSTCLPNLNSAVQRTTDGDRVRHSVEALPNVVGHVERDSDGDSDSDSTDYMEPPSPRVPPLPLEDFHTDDTDSSTDDDLDESVPQVTINPVKSFQLKKHGAITRNRLKKDFSETTRLGKKKNSEWSVTVAGTVELSRSAPDLEMRLSFPVNEDSTAICHQSDSGFGEESNYTKKKESAREHTVPSSLSSGNLKQKWTVTVGNSGRGAAPHSGDGNTGKNLNQQTLPILDGRQRKGTKNVLKGDHVKKRLRELVARKLYVIWPKVQRIVQEEFMTDSGRLITEYPQEIGEDCFLYVKGAAVALEKKEKPLTMTERDITKR